MLEAFSYCPILHTRVSEIKALFQLPNATKDRLLPILVARPWPNARQLQRTWEKIGEALGGRRYGLDLDRVRWRSGGVQEAAEQFDLLFDNNGGFANYYDLLSGIPAALPVLRIRGGIASEFDAQADNVDRLDRGVIVRLERGSITNPLSLVEQVLNRFDDVAIFIDAGWSNDLLGHQVWASNIIERATSIRPEIELVVSGSSFPDAFTNVGERGVIPVRERYLYASLVRRHNAAVLTYGDWGSTRPPSPPIPMKNVPRIDLPTDSNWIAFRRDKDVDDVETYAEIARRVIGDPDWPADLNIWGTYTIGCTAAELPGAIRSPSVSAAVRINIHMHRQTFFGAANTVNDGEEPFTDD